MTKSKGVDPQLLHPSDPDMQLNNTIHGESPEPDRTVEKGMSKHSSEEKKKHCASEKPKKAYLYERRRPSGASHCTIINQRAVKSSKEKEKLAVRKEKPTIESASNYGSLTRDSHSYRSLIKHSARPSTLTESGSSNVQ